MATSLRTQIYLTPEQRARIDELRKRDDRSLADIVREALDAFLNDEIAISPADALAATFGAMPDLEVASRDEWDRG